MRGKLIFVLNVLFLNFVLQCQGSQRRCHIAWFRTFHSRTDTCVVKFAHREPLPSWLDKLQLEKSLTNASDEELDALAKDACSCAFFRVMRSCPASVYAIVKALSWRCFPGARDHVMKRLVAAVERRSKSPTIQENGAGEHDMDMADIVPHSQASKQSSFDSDGRATEQTEKVESGSGEPQRVTFTTEHTDGEEDVAEGSTDDSTTLISTNFSSAPVDDTTQDESASTDGTAMPMDTHTEESEEVNKESSGLEVHDVSTQLWPEGRSVAHSAAAEANQKTKIEQQYDGHKEDGIYSEAEEKDSDYDTDEWKNL